MSSAAPNAAQNVPWLSYLKNPAIPSATNATTLPAGSLTSASANTHAVVHHTDIVLLNEILHRMQMATYIQYSTGYSMLIVNKEVIDFIRP